MAERKVAGSSSGPASGPRAQDAAASRRRTTQRVAPLPRGGSELPGWIWAGLGCLSVLAAGFSVMFLVVNPVPPLPTAAVNVEAAASPAAAGEATPSPGSIQVVPLAVSPAEPAPPQAHRPKPPRSAPPRAVRVARSPSAPVPSEKSKTAPAEDTESVEEELLKPAKARTAAKTRSAAPEGEEAEEAETSASD